MSSISLTKALRTPKVSNDPGNVAFTVSNLFDENNKCAIPQLLIDSYGRPTSIDGGLPFLGNGAPACSTALYRISTENMLRPQYSEYLNVPQGMQLTQNEYVGRSYYDTLGVNRDRAFGNEGQFLRMSAPTANPASDKSWYDQQAFLNNRIVNKFDNRVWLNSADSLQSGF